MDTLDIIRRTVSDQSYADCLIFRQKLYNLKPILYQLVKETFIEFQIHLQRDQETDATVADRCKQLGMKVKKGHDFNGWDAANGWQILAHYFVDYFPVDGDVQKVDLSTLLRIICFCKLFSSSTYPELITAATDVRILRNKFYGHIPELHITGGLKTHNRKLNKLTKIVTRNLQFP
jgi:hypothetical protein